MLYFDIKNYDEFRELFGIRETGTGEKVRKNKVALKVLKDMFRNKENNLRVWKLFFVRKTAKQPKTQNDLINASRNVGHSYRKFGNNLAEKYTLRSDIYEIVDRGLCYDGDTHSVRYKKDGKIYKMKAAKFYGKIFRENGLDKIYGESMQIFGGEIFSTDWAAYAENGIGVNYTLHVGNALKDFRKIYGSSDFGSCMAGNMRYKFYTSAVNASAAWLENAEGDMVARCVIFNECKQNGTGKIFRLAERQYAEGQDDKLKGILVGKLYAGGYIDANKRVGAGCGRNFWQDFVDMDGNQIENGKFSITCKLNLGDTLSYQDSFKEYDIDTCTAFNFGSHGFQLDTTDSELRGNYDDWAERYTSMVLYLVYWWQDGGMRSGHTTKSNRDDHFTYVECGQYECAYLYEDDVVTVDGWHYWDQDPDICEVNGDWYLKRDCIEIDGEWRLKKDDNDAA